MKSALLLTTLFATSMAADAEIVLTYSNNPTQAFASPSDEHVLTFSSLLAGADTGAPWGVSSFSQTFTSSVDGSVSTLGAKGASQAHLGTGALTSTLTLAQNSSYFGMWWAAGNPDNVLQFYEGSQLVGTFDMASLSGLLPESLLNDNGKGNGPSAFINFIGDAGTQWDKIVLTNNRDSSKGSDNAATRVVVYNPMVDGVLPGLPVGLVNGSTSTQVPTAPLASTDTTGLSVVSAAPGAPAPPMGLLAAFAGGIVLRKAWARRQRRGPKTEENE